MEISEKEWKNLNNEVVTLRDELARMKRVYEDLFYNLDDNNFSGRFLKEKNGMKAKITATEEEYKRVYEKTQSYDGKIAELSTTVTQTADEISSKASQSDVDNAYNTLSSEISQTANSISAEVRKNIILSNAEIVTNTNDMADTNKIYALNGYYYYYNSVSGDFEEIDSDTIYSFFEQTSDGFRLKGNILINGNLVKTVDNDGNVIELNKGFINLITSDMVEKSNPKMQLGFTKTTVNNVTTTNPYILLGAGDGNFETSIPNIPFKSSAGTIYKNSNGMMISYMTSDLDTMGIQFLEENAMKFYGNIDFSGADSINLGTTVTATAVFG